MYTFHLSILKCWHLFNYMKLSDDSLKSKFINMEKTASNFDTPKSRCQCLNTWHYQGVLAPYINKPQPELSELYAYTN